MLDIRMDGQREIIIEFGELSKKIPRQMRRATQDSLWLLETAIKRKLTNDVLNVGTGRLRNSITNKMMPGEAISGYVGTNVEYARIHELGGTITAKNSQYLTIPFPGVKGKIRDYPWGFFLRSKAGNLIFAGPPGNQKKFMPSKEDRTWANFTPLFILKKSVTIPARPSMAPAMSENLNKIKMIFEKYIDEALKN